VGRWAKGSKWTKVALGETLTLKKNIVQRRIYPLLPCNNAGEGGNFPQVKRWIANCTGTRTLLFWSKKYLHPVWDVRKTGTCSKDRNLLERHALERQELVRKTGTCSKDTL